MMTSMDEPLGAKVGNWLEIEETMEVLRGGGPADVVEVVVAQCAQMLLMGGGCATLEEGAAKARSGLADGSALAKFAAMVEAQGGDARLVTDESYAEAHKPRAPFTAEVRQCLRVPVFRHYFLAYPRRSCPLLLSCSSH